jgi:hypothetical protein
VRDLARLRSDNQVVGTAVANPYGGSEEFGTVVKRSEVRVDRACDPRPFVIAEKNWKDVLFAIAKDTIKRSGIRYTTKSHDRVTKLRNRVRGFGADLSIDSAEFAKIRTNYQQRIGREPPRRLTITLT